MPVLDRFFCSATACCAISDAGDHPVRDLFQQRAHSPIRGEDSSIRIVCGSVFHNLEAAGSHDDLIMQSHELKSEPQTNLARLPRKFLLQHESLRIETIIAVNRAWRGNDHTPKAAFLQGPQQQGPNHSSRSLGPLIGRIVTDFVRPCEVHHSRCVEGWLSLRRAHEQYLLRLVFVRGGWRTLCSRLRTQ